jgi:hypothetical protein
MKDAIQGAVIPLSHDMAAGYPEPGLGKEIPIFINRSVVAG